MQRNGVFYFWRMDIKSLYQLFRESNGVCTDTRNLKLNSLFFALKGDNFNGNEFALQALAKGCEYAVVDDPAIDHDRAILVNNGLDTLQDLARFHRRRFNIPIIGLTGSNGKTTTKELIYAVLSKKYRCHATSGNLNNHIGVPLTLLSMTDETDIAIIEMGANKPNDIGELCRIAEPNYGIITNIGRAHLEGLGGVEGIIRAKGQLYDFLREHAGQVFVHTSDMQIMKMAHGLKKHSYATDSNSAEVNGSLVANDLQIAFEWQENKNKLHRVATQLSGSYNLPNLMAAVAVGLWFEVPDVEINGALRDYRPNNNRSQIKKSEHNTLILDAYNANPTSVTLALRDFTALPVANDKKLAILGDMLELGKESKSDHEKILQQLKNSGVQALLVGPEFTQAAKSAGLAFQTFDNASSAAEYLRKEPAVGFHILIKGSRGIRLEQLVDLL